MSKIATAERVSRDASDNFVYQRSRLAYIYASEHLNGRVLEIGTGSGYGIEILAPHCTKFVTLDKHLPSVDRDHTLPSNVEMVNCTVPPLPFPDNSFDHVVTFQVIEHIESDTEFVAEIYRVLKPGGHLIVSTPNAPMSLTRNPWHVREYSAEALTALLRTKFDEQQIVEMGVVGNSKVMEYYEENRKGVAKITRLDIFDLQHRLPRALLQLPYDILNRINRRRLLRDNRDLTQGIDLTDYQLSEQTDRAFDLLYTAQK
ncbi:MAG: methyltransferase domain-containing protein [Rikenellaceae bacterium]